RPQSTLLPYTTLFRSTVLQTLGIQNHQIAPAGFVLTRDHTHQIALAFCRISRLRRKATFGQGSPGAGIPEILSAGGVVEAHIARSEEHTSELQSRENL